MSELEEIQALLREANARGDRVASEGLIQRIEQIQATAQEGYDVDSTPVSELVRRAQVDAAPDYTKGLIFMGRGFDRLMKGVEQLGYDVARPFAPRQSEFGEQQLAERYQRETEAYEPLAQEYPGSAVFGEIMGETAPFLNLPVPRVSSIFEAGGLLRSPINVAGRASPEAVAGSLEGQLPYVDPTESGAPTRGERAVVDAVGSAVASRFTDALGRRASASRGRMADPDLEQVMREAEEVGVPIRQGTQEEQTAAAEQIAYQQGVGERSDMEIGTQVVEDLNEVFEDKTQHFNNAYSAVLDSTQFGNIDLGPFQRRMGALLQAEQAKGSQANRDLMNEYKRWVDTPTDNLTPKRLQEYRTALRERQRGLAPEQATMGARLQEIDDMITGTLTQEMERIAPGSGEMLTNLDNWFYDEVARLRRVPQVRNALGENPMPQNLVNWMLTKPNETKQAVFNSLSNDGKEMMREAFFNTGYRRARQGAKFNPLSYSKFIENNMDTIRTIMPERADGMETLSKVMRYASAEGKVLDSSFWNMIRGFPFLYRSVIQNARRSNFFWRLQNADPSLSPDSPEMDRFYRSLIRGLAIQDPERVSEGIQGTREQMEDSGMLPLDL